MNQELSNFAARLRETISFGGHCFVNAPINQGSDEALPSMRGDDAIFNQFALDLFALQIKHNGAYRIICAARGLTPEAVGHWTQIPAVPTTAFKELELSCIPPDQRTAVFHSSGTSKQKPSRHFHCPASLELYEASLWSWFHRHVVPECGIAECGIRNFNSRATARASVPFLIGPHVRNRTAKYGWGERPREPFRICRDHHF